VRRWQQKYGTIEKHKGGKKIQSLLWIEWEQKVDWKKLKLLDRFEQVSDNFLSDSFQELNESKK
jgi:hypothetical protein